MFRPATSYRYIKLLLAALLTSLVSPVALAVSTTISSTVNATYTPNTDDSITIDSGGSIARTGNTTWLYGINVTSGKTGISIINNGAISVTNADSFAWGIYVGGAVASLNNSGTITASSSFISKGIGVSSDGSITTLTNSGSISKINVDGDSGMGDTPGTITTLNNSGTITTLDITEADTMMGTAAGIVTTLNNSGTISSAVAMAAGTLNLTGTAGSISGAVTGTGAVNVSGTFTSGNTFSNGTFAIASGGVFTQGHTVTTTGGFSNAGTHVVAAGTTANITGNYSPDSAGTFRSNVTNSTTFGKLAVSGTASLPATMNINIVTGNNCAGVSSGQTLASVISAGTLTENSTTYTVTDDCSGLNFTATKNGNAIDVTAASAASAPTATTGTTNSVGQTSATLNGTINDNGASTTVSFDYGTTNAYGTNVAATTGDTVSAGAGSTAVAVTLTGLTCNTTYHFRVKGVNSVNTTNGSDATLTTTACAVNGACGSSNATSVSSAPSTNLCATGTASAVSGSGPWSWSCTGSNGGSTANCSASVYVEPPPPPPPPITLPTGGGTGTVTTGGNTIVVTNNGSTGTTINLGGSGTNSNTVQLPGTGSVTVTNTGSATLSVGTSGSNSVLNVTSGSATVTASSSGQPLAMGNGLILVTANNSGASATVSASGSSAPVVNTGGNTTVTILGTPTEVAGASLQLVGSGSGGAPVTFQAAAGATPITLQPGSAGTVFTVQPITGASGSQTSGLVVSWGSVSITVPGSGSTGIAVGNQAVTGSAGSSLVVSGLAGQQQVWVTGGTVTLPTPSAQTTARLERSSRIVSTDRLPNGTLYAGETAIIDADGNVTTAYIGSPSANQGLTGDRLDMPVIAGLSIDRAGTRISGTATRLSADLETTIFDVLQNHGFSRSDNSADSLGAFDFSGAGEHGAMHTFRGMVSGRVSIDHRQADGIALVGNGGIAMTQGGVSVTLVPAVANLEAFAAAVKSLDGSLSLNLHTDGSFLAHFSGARRYALQPGYEVADTDGAAGFGSDPAGGYITYTDPQGRRQAFYPAAADFATLLAELQKADASASLTGDAAGTLTLTFGDRSMRLKPDFELIGVPQDKIGQPWWIGTDGKFYVQVKNVLAYRGVAQGFAVE